ncbi:hypothetical protein B0A54_08144 [Friedmanniomyces endolithicus]|uniref:DUF6590 domain-containing protein n=1 Tax=Friedmanniomyces endolithicus TaxID=329885 RepID=A0A4U0UZM4_9PEZI|nr:hypothetical protein LTS09_012722 [Friedmanniomyces endolithicus]KAK0306359.1 hypothetical protein LTR01_006217 [Friedmanniomyces endolithicus]KAK0825027.1 hypothetical protein LTR73_007314 [Friedmanniomyces endolithicus]TKA41718.1 hypothetical protein B0A54_08144 [Friedmanniomyces endolithicus]
MEPSAHTTHDGARNDHSLRQEVSSADPRKLRPSFQQQHNPTKFFTFGKLVRAQLPRPSGVNDGPWVVPGRLDNHIYDKPAIYLVIRKGLEGVDSCVVVPVTSYGHQGFAKMGINKSDHAIIHTTAVSPEPILTEPSNVSGVKTRAIRVVPYFVVGTLFELTEDTVINFGKPRELEHYVRVEPLGEVHTDSLEDLHHCVAESWQRPVVADARTGKNHGPLIEGQYLPDVMAMNSIYKIISGTPGLVEESDPTYRRHGPKWFKPGKIIMLLSGEEQPGNPDEDEEPPITDFYVGVSHAGVPHMQQPRYFFIVGADEDSCYCLRIMTYQGRGLSDLPAGIRFDDHSVIHSSKNPPKLSRKERAASREPLMAPIRIRSNDRAQDLDPTARLLWTRIYKVKIDVKAHSFGHLRSGYEEVVTKEFERLNRGCKLTSLRRSDVESSESDASDREVVLVDRHRLPCFGMNKCSILKFERKKYVKGQRVALLVARNALQPSPQYRLLRIKSVHYAVGPLGGEWEYALKYADHEGHFCPGVWFPEDMLMAESSEVPSFDVSD